MRSSRSRKQKRNLIIMLLLIAAAVAVLFVTMTLIERRGLLDQQFGDTGEWGDEDIDLFFGDKEYCSSDRVDTYLLIGTDGGGDDLGEAYCGDLADFLMLILVDNTTGRYAFYQIDRNTMVEMQICDEKGNFTSFATQQICIAHWYGLDEDARNNNTKSAVSILLGGLDIDHYYTISMADIGKLNNAVGGVTVKIESDLTKADPAFVKGAEVKLTDEQAESFVRARMSLDDDTNAARMARQNQYLQSAYRLITSRLSEDPEYINDLYDQLSDVVETDGSKKDLSVLTNHIMEYKDMGFLKFDGDTRIADTQGDGEEHEEFYASVGSIIENLRKVIDLKEVRSTEEDE